jgi:hypothetical protein
VSGAWARRALGLPAAAAGAAGRAMPLERALADAPEDTPDSVSLSGDRT